MQPYIHNLPNNRKFKHASFEVVKNFSGWESYIMNENIHISNTLKVEVASKVIFAALKKKEV